MVSRGLLRRTPDPDSLTSTPKKAAVGGGKSGRVIHLTAFGGTMHMAGGGLATMPAEPHVTELHQ